MIGIIYGSTLGNTEDVANKIANELGLECKVVNVSDIKPSDINAFDKLIIGSSTWNDGELQDDWESFDFDSLEINGKTTAFFGTGDSQSYSDTFCNAMGILYETFKEKGANIVGQTDTSEYNFDESSAVIDNKFIGLALDIDNENDKTDERIANWVNLIKPNFE
ncbi:flavodoxin FldA [Campylobacter sputorum subsp. bubulus]|uniref:Flavodoxin n=1 Tax=Campylobacter sputorum subsp. sputorum TaxID=32024 RepID=A0A381DIQ3_9BACT|nr:flavodoxin FldA [Campylobacter sputorum]ASM35615.1 flavodoxin [Campylobacter sputorum aubsp. sputorum RM3237]KAB0582654.1 flavodoxin FldA [Campylobacter sputorum subsp. sputorum]QEL05806.1 flavodoxin [Campylobacter sputorum subsp. sputorum]SUX08039.1 flavodoxin FldA [Campylobacter sputorum subsp. bubulus]SUX10584.1 flavodoxin FldA [Campylobacter sputorum subsp. sputorum]